MYRKYKSRDDSSATAGSRRRSTSTNSGPPTSSTTAGVGFDPFQRREDRSASNRPSTSSAPVGTGFDPFQRIGARSASNRPLTSSATAGTSVEIQQPLQMCQDVNAWKKQWQEKIEAFHARKKALYEAFEKNFLQKENSRYDNGKLTEEGEKLKKKLEDKNYAQMHYVYIDEDKTQKTRTFEVFSGTGPDNENDSIKWDKNDMFGASGENIVTEDQYYENDLQAFDAIEASQKLKDENEDHKKHYRGFDTENILAAVFKKMIDKREVPRNGELLLLSEAPFCVSCRPIRLKDSIIKSMRDKVKKEKTESCILKPEAGTETLTHKAYKITSSDDPTKPPNPSILGVLGQLQKEHEDISMTFVEYESKRNKRLAVLYRKGSSVYEYEVSEHSFKK